MANMRERWWQSIEKSWKVGPAGPDWLLSDWILKSDWVGALELAIFTEFNQECIDEVRSTRLWRPEQLPVVGQPVFTFKEHHFRGLADAWLQGRVRGEALSNLAAVLDERCIQIVTGVVRHVLTQLEGSGRLWSEGFGGDLWHRSWSGDNSASALEKLSEPVDGVVLWHLLLLARGHGFSVLVDAKIALAVAAPGGMATDTLPSEVAGQALDGLERWWSRRDPNVASAISSRRAP